MNKINHKNLVNLIRSCDFLPKEVIEKWENNLAQIPESFYPWIWRTFEEAKQKVDATYAEFELNRDKNGAYNQLINEKSSNAVKIVKSLKLREVSGLIGL